MLAAICDELEFDVLTFIESAEARSLDRRDVDEHIFAAAASGGLNESETLLHIVAIVVLPKNLRKCARCRATIARAADPNSALSSEGPIRGEHQTRPELEWTKL